MHTEAHLLEQILGLMLLSFVFGVFLTALFTWQPPKTTWYQKSLKHR